MQPRWGVALAAVVAITAVSVARADVPKPEDITACNDVRAYSSSVAPPRAPCWKT
jgi:hypothetical protein